MTAGEFSSIILFLARGKKSSVAERGCPIRKPTNCWILALAASWSGLARFAWIDRRPPLTPARSNSPPNGPRRRRGSKRVAGSEGAWRGTLPAAWTIRLRCLPTAAQAHAVWPRGDVSRATDQLALDRPAGGPADASHPSPESVCLHRGQHAGRGRCRRRGGPRRRRPQCGPVGPPKRPDFRAAGRARFVGLPKTRDALSAGNCERGNRYHAIVLDPPSYGHGPQGETWKLSSDLFPLLTDCRRLLTDDPAFVLLTCHSPGYGPAEVGACLQDSIFGRCTSQVEARSLNLRTAAGRRLSAGALARWPRR